MLHTAVVLDAGSTTDGARTRLEAHAPDAYVVIRSRIGLVLTFHTFRSGDLIGRLDGMRAGGATPLRDALALDAHGAAPVIQVADLDRSAARDFAGVVLDGVAVVGVSEPRARRRMSAPPDRATPEPVPLAATPPVGGPPEPPPSAAPPRMRGGGGKLMVQRRPEAGPARRMRGFGGGSGGMTADLPAAPDAGPPEASAESVPLAPGTAPTPAAPVRFDAHARLDLAKEVVSPGERFELGIGLAREAQAGVMGGGISAELPADTQSFDLDVRLVADGFESPGGWHFRLNVPTAEPERARLVITLIAPHDEVTRLSLLEVHFSHRGVPCGVAFRRIAVQPAGHGNATTAALPASRTASWTSAANPAPVTKPALRIDPDDPPPDLTITISKPDGNDATGRFYWSFASPHAVALPPAPVPIDLGDDARTFAGRMIQLVTRAEGTALIDQALNGLGRQVRDKAPDLLEDVLRDVWRAVEPEGRVPTVLLHSAEPHVPWELARLDDPPDPSLPPFLGAQFAVGRWILGPRGVRVPPAREVEVRAMAVVAGDYRSSLNLRPLPKAVAEGAELQRRWGAVRLAATVDDMNSLLEASLEKDGARVGGADAIHFACHGEVDARNPRDAMIFLDDDWPLEPSLFLDAPVARSHEPFLFLNACQVGQAGELLGDYAGFAGCCLRAGFRGFVAPLWSVSDDIAHEIALAFYDRAFARRPAPVAEILRELRGRYPLGERVPPSTWLAYVFYGNPSFVLRRADL